jgi:hypothetical protein
MNSNVGFLLPSLNLVMEKLEENLLLFFAPGLFNFLWRYIPPTSLPSRSRSSSISPFFFSFLHTYVLASRHLLLDRIIQLEWYLDEQQKKLLLTLLCTPKKKSSSFPSSSHILSYSSSSSSSSPPDDLDSLDHLVSLLLSISRSLFCRAEWVLPSLAQSYISFLSNHYAFSSSWTSLLLSQLITRSLASPYLSPPLPNSSSYPLSPSYSSSSSSFSLWSSHPEVLEYLIETKEVDATISKYLLPLPSWNSHPKLVFRLLENGTCGRNLYARLLLPPSAPYSSDPLLLTHLQSLKSRERELQVHLNKIEEAELEISRNEGGLRPGQEFRSGPRSVQGGLKTIQGSQNGPNPGQGVITGVISLGGGSVGLDFRRQVEGVEDWELPFLGRRYFEFGELVRVPGSGRLFRIQSKANEDGHTAFVYQVSEVVRHTRDPFVLARLEGIRYALKVAFFLSFFLAFFLHLHLHRHLLFLLLPILLSSLCSLSFIMSFLPSLGCKVE